MINFIIYLTQNNKILNKYVIIIQKYLINIINHISYYTNKYFINYILKKYLLIIYHIKYFINHITKKYFINHISYKIFY
jgi:hypothetical protein